jgi:hypothetical protein
MRKLFSFMLLALAAIATAQKTVDVTIKVVSPDGKPMPGIQIGQMWVAEKPGEAVAPRNGLKTDANGVAKGAQSLSRDAIVLMAYDPAKKLGGFLPLSEADANKDLVLKMEALVPVDLNFEIPNWPGGRADGFFNVFRKVDKSMSLCFAQPMELKNKLLLPPGEYMIGMFSFDTKSYQKQITVEAGKPVDLGTEKLEMSAVAKMWGKPAAEITVTDARGVAKTVKLSDYRGKWVLLEFWGYW